jgi:hypothetical protein
MSLLTLEQVPQTETTDASWTSIYYLGSASALLQLVCVFGYIIVAITLGPKPGTVEEYYTLFQTNPLAGFLRSDGITLIIIALYLGTCPALYVTLKSISPIYTGLAALFIMIAVTISFAIHADFSLLHLSDQYAAATTAIQRSHLLAAGEAVIASNTWNSSGAYMTGILLQGAGVMISVIMLRSKDFSKVTAYTGLLANGFDLVQHMLHPFAPSVAGIVMLGAGPFYLVWFPMLARDLFRLGQNVSKDTV